MVQRAEMKSKVVEKMIEKK